MVATRCEVQTSSVLDQRRFALRDVMFAVAAVLLGAWALFQNFFKIGTAPIFADEPTYALAGWQYLHGSVQPSRFSKATPFAVSGNFEHPPLAKYLFGLAQLLGGTPASITSARCVSASATVLIGVVIAVWVGRVANRWTGLLAGALVTVLPQAAAGSDGSIGRFAMLDPVASAFAVLAVLLAWEWSQREGRGAWVFAVSTGVAAGLAAGSKENGFLGAVGPVTLAVLLAFRTRRRALILPRLAQAVLAAVVALVGFLLLYLPFGNPVSGIRYLIDFQWAQASGGHLIGFAGQVSMRPPWWANLWFAGHGYGSVLTVFIVTTALWAVVSRRDLLVGWCLAAVTAPVVFHCFIAGVTLGYYWVMWTPMVLVLSALGAGDLIERVARAPRLTASVISATVSTVVAGLVVLAVPVGKGVEESITVADIHPEGPQRLPSLMAQYGLSGPIASTGVGTWNYGYYVPNTQVYSLPSDKYSITAASDADTIVVAKLQCRDPLDASVRALVAVNEASGHVREIYSDELVSVYAVTGHLAMPTAAQVAAQPVSNQTDGC